jgi:hypothetical protein
MAPITTVRLRGFLSKPSPGRSLIRGAWWCLELAKLHAALAQVVATALTCDGREWVKVAGCRFGTIESVVPGRERHLPVV